MALPSSRSTLKERISPSRASRSSSLVLRFQMRLDRAWSCWNLEKRHFDLEGSKAKESLPKPNRCKVKIKKMRQHCFGRLFSIQRQIPNYIDSALLSIIKSGRAPQKLSRQWGLNIAGLWLDVFIGTCCTCSRKAPS